MIRPRCLVLGSLFGAALLSGCGGTEGGIDPVELGPVVKISADASYNGDRSQLQSAHGLEGATTGDVTSGLAHYDGRVIEVTLPTATPGTGEAFTPGQGGVKVSYVQEDGKRWNAVGGSVRVTFDEATVYNVALQGVTLEPESGSAARGSFRLTGEVDGLPYGVDRGPGDLTLTPTGSGTTAMAGSITESGRSHFSDRHGINLSIRAPLPDDRERSLLLSIPNVAAGASGTFDGTASRMTYVESEAHGVNARVWRSFGGGWRVVSRSRSNIEVALTDVRFEMAPSSSGPVTEPANTFSVAGTMRR